MKVTNAAFHAIDKMLDTTSHVSSLFGLAFKWRFNFDFRAATNKFMDDIHSTVKAFINISPCELA